MLEYLERLPQELRPFLTEKTFCKGESILYSGEKNQNIYWVKRGCAIGYVEGWNGSLAFLDRYETGDLFGELEIFCEGLDTINIIAQPECTVLILHKQYLLAWMEKDFIFTQAIIRHLAHAMHRNSDKRARLQLLTVEDRVKKCISTYEMMGMLDRLDKKTLMLGAMASLRSVNRAINNLVHSGVIRVEKKKIQVLDSSQLEIQEV